MTIANTEMAEAWDGEEGAHWAEQAEHYERANRRLWHALVDRVPVDAEAQVLDIGCGNGRSTRDLARMASSGHVLGVDLSAQMLNRARATAEREGLANVRFEQADAQVHPFAGDTFHLATSSFGAMFFADPVAAFSNIGRALRPGGGLALLAWREPARNEWIRIARTALAAGRQLPEPPPSAPGPFGLAVAEHVHRVLGSAGFSDVRLDEIDEPVDLGPDPDEAFAFLRTTGMAKGLLQDLDEQTRERALAGLRQSLVEHQTDEGVLAGASAWLITARRGQA